MKGEVDGAWRRILISYARRHYDYEATVHAHFRLRRFGDRALVLVFMYTSYPGSADEIPGILKSVRPADHAGSKWCPSHDFLCGLPRATPDDEPGRV